MPTYTVNLAVTIYADNHDELMLALSEHDYDDSEVIAITEH